MDDLKFKTPEQIKLRVSEASETLEPDVSAPQPATAAMVKANDPEDLLRTAE